jgi:hypothetical protein
MIGATVREILSRLANALLEPGGLETIGVHPIGVFVSLSSCLKSSSSFVLVFRKIHVAWQIVITIHIRSKSRNSAKRFGLLSETPELLQRPDPIR